MKWVGMVQVVLLLINILFFYINTGNQKALYARTVHTGELDSLIEEARTAVKAQNSQFRLAAAKVGLNLDDEGSRGSCAEELRMLKGEIKSAMNDLEKNLSQQEELGDDYVAEGEEFAEEGYEEFEEQPESEIENDLQEIIKELR